MTHPTTAILLAAGCSRRLGALTETRPKCLLEIAYQVGFRFNSDRQAQQDVGNAGRLPRSSTHSRMGHRCRVSNQAFNAAKRFCQGENLQGIDEAPDFLKTAFQFHAQHRAEPGLLRLGDGVTRMRRKPGVVNSGDLRMTG